MPKATARAWLMAAPYQYHASIGKALVCPMMSDWLLIEVCVHDCLDLYQDEGKKLKCLEPVIFYLCGHSKIKAFFIFDIQELPWMFQFLILHLNSYTPNFLCKDLTEGASSNKFGIQTQ